MTETILLLLMIPLGVALHRLIGTPVSREIDMYEEAFSTYEMARRNQREIAWLKRELQKKKVLDLETPKIGGGEE